MSDLTQVELHIRIDYGKSRFHALDVDTKDTIFDEETVGFAGVDFYALLFAHIRNEYRLLIGRSMMETLISDLGIAVPGETDAIWYITGRNLITGLPAKQEITSPELFELAKSTLSSREIEHGIKQVLYPDFYSPRRITGAQADREEEIPIYELHREPLYNTMARKNLELHSIVLEKGNFPPVRGYDRWLQQEFDVSVKYADSE